MSQRFEAKSHFEKGDPVKIRDGCYCLRVAEVDFDIFRKKWVVLIVVDEDDVEHDPPPEPR